MAELSGLTSVVGIAGDVRDASHREALAAAARGLGRLDLLVNNASTLGASPLPALDAIDLDVLREIFEVNVVAPLALTQELLPLLVASHGTIVNVTSDAAVEAYEGGAATASSKAAFEHVSASSRRAARRPRARRRSRRHAHRDAPGRVPRRGHLRPPVAGGDRARLLALIEGDQPSGRYEVSGAGVMTAVMDAVGARSSPLDPVARSARAARGARRAGRDDVRLLVSNGDTDVVHATFADLPHAPASAATSSS